MSDAMRLVWRAIVMALLGAMALTTLAGEASAQAIVLTTQTSPACAALPAADFSRVIDAPTHLTSAKTVAAAGDAPAYCEVEGFVAPQVGILARLPLSGWNGRFLETGCGGFCGMFNFISLCDAPLRRGYACIATDMGHRGNEAEGVEWAYNNPQAVIDFAFRATHVTALAGKAIVERFYGRKPDRSYFHGCSCGGRQALVEAERFPYDFDGIVVGAPALSYVDVTLEFALRARDLYANGKPLFDAKSIALLGAAVVARCDLNDGVKDGLIGDPRGCRFDPQSIACAGGATDGCLTPAQVTAARAFYAEQRSKSGVTLGQKAMAPGSETSVLGMADIPLMTPRFYEDFFKYMALRPNPGPSWTFAQFDLDRDYQRLGEIHMLMDADNPDFSRFKAAGGKLIYYHGWGDGALSPLNSIAFYQTIERTMGGRAQTDDFLRLFLVPGMDHCSGGKGAWDIDYLAYLETWVERGKAPDVMIGKHEVDYTMGDLPHDRRFSRPVYPYPLVARYKGGDPNSAASFKPVRGEP